MASSVDGLISGLSTTDLISQLMQIESAGKTRLQSKVTAQEKVNTAFQTLNTKVAALKTAATDITGPTMWMVAKAASSSSSLTATASAGAASGSLTFNVTQLAKSALKTTTIASADESIVSGGGTDFSLTVGTTSTPLTAASSKASDVVAAINEAKLGVTASLITAGDGTTVLQLASSKTGVANDFSVSGLTPTLSTVTEAQDAKISVGVEGQPEVTPSPARRTRSPTSCRTSP